MLSAEIGIRYCSELEIDWNSTIKQQRKEEEIQRI